MATWYVSLHTADPAGGDQTTSEVGYGRYSRVGLDSWTTSSWTISNALDIEFPINTSHVYVVTHVAVGTAKDGAGSILFSGALSEATTIYPTSRPSFDAGNLSVNWAGYFPDYFFPSDFWDGHYFQEVPGVVSSAVLSITRKRRQFVPYDDEQKWQGRCVATAHFANVSASAAIIRKAPPAPLPAIVHIISQASLHAHHAEAYGLVLHDNTDRLNREEEDEVIALLLMAA